MENVNASELRSETTFSVKHIADRAGVGTLHERQCHDFPSEEFCPAARCKNYIADVAERCKRR